MQALKFKTSVLFCMLVSYTIEAQIEPPTLMPGLAVAYASNLDVAGINARLYYAADHHYCFGPEISYFKKDTEDLELSLFEANINLHYILDLNHGLGIYPLGGINYTIETEREKHGATKERITEDAFGLNVGGGLHYATGRMLFFAEYKYVISALDDHFFSIGALINFSLAKNEHRGNH